MALWVGCKTRNGDLFKKKIIKWNEYTYWWTMQMFGDKISLSAFSAYIQLKSGIN